ARAPSRAWPSPRRSSRSSPSSGLPLEFSTGILQIVPRNLQKCDLLLVGQVPRQNNSHLGNQITRGLVRPLHAMSANAESLSSRRARGNGHAYGPLGGWHFHLGPLHRFGQRDRHVDFQVTPLPSEYGVGCDLHRDQNITRRSPRGSRLPLSANANLLSRLDAGGHLAAHRLHLAASPPPRKRRLPPLNCRGNSDRQWHPEVRSPLGLGGAPAGGSSPAARKVPKQVGKPSLGSPSSTEQIVQVELKGLPPSGTPSRPGTRSSPRPHRFEPGTVFVVHF